MILLDLERPPTAEELESGAPIRWAYMLAAPDMMASPWGVMLPLFGYPTGTATWEVSGVAQHCGVAWGIGLANKDTGAIVRSMPFDHGRITGLNNGDIITVRYRFCLDIGRFRI